MEADGQKLYSVLTKTEVREKMMNEINQISEFFSVSKSDATVILIHLRWNTFLASDRLGDDKEKFLSELGLDLEQNESNSVSAVQEMIPSDAHGDSSVSTTFCSHKFPITCWIKHLEQSLEKKSEERVVISCLNQDCVALVAPDMVKKLPDPVKEMYEEYVLRSFVEGNKNSIKWCPANGCDYAIELREDLDGSIDIGVVCLCGHTFCWSCQLESHRPVTCKNASLWLNRILDQARSFAWIAKNTKNCPNCNRPVQKDDHSELRLVTCVCSCSFCWICFRSEEDHQRKWNCVENAFFIPPMNDEKGQFEFDQIFHMDLWDANLNEIQKAKAEMEAIDHITIPRLMKTCVLVEQDIKAIREAWMLIVQCTQVLKWICVFDYFITAYDKEKKEFLNHRRGQVISVLLNHKYILKGLMSDALSVRAFNFLSHKLETLTAYTGNYFHEFVKNLELGLSGNEPVPYWFCSRCTCQNSWSDQMCKVCYLSLGSSSTSHDNNNTANANHHQGPNKPNNPSPTGPIKPNNPSAREEEENEDTKP